MASRLSRLDEIYDGYSIFFITACTHQRHALLNNAALHTAFRTFCENARAHNILVGRYVLMPDHAHFFVTLPDADMLPMWMKSFKNSLSKVMREAGHAAPHWQKTFFDHVVRSEASYEDKWIYVQQNPVRAGLVAEARDWPYQGELNRVLFGK